MGLPGYIPALPIAYRPMYRLPRGTREVNAPDRANAAYAAVYGRLHSNHHFRRPDAVTSGTYDSFLFLAVDSTSSSRQL